MGLQFGRRAMAVAGSVLALALAGAARGEVIRQVQGTATLEDLPPVSPQVAEAVQRYQSSRPAALEDWLSDGSLLIGTRFSTTVQLHRIAAPMGARTQLTFYGEPIGGATRVRGGPGFFFVKDTGGDEWFQLYRMDPGGQPTAFSEPGTRNELPVVSRDGRQLFWARSTKGSASYAILAARTGDPASRHVVFQDPGAVSVEDVSDDGGRVLLARRVSLVQTRLLALDVASGKVAELTPGPGALFEGARFVRGGAAVVAISDRGADVSRLVEIDIASGRQRELLAPSKWEADAFDISDDGRTLALLANVDGYSELSLIDLASGKPLGRPALPKGVAGAPHFSPDGRQLALTIASSTSPGDVYAVRVADGAVTRWTESEAGPLDRRTLVEPQLIRFASFDGLSVPAFVYRPARASAAEKTPVLIIIHGGPEGQERPGWNPAVQYFADQLGATVITPNVRGSTGYGRRYLDLDNGAKREDTLKDIGALIDWVGTRPELDARRVAVLGGSYGGYMVLGTMTKYSDRLAGAVESFGISNWVSFLEHTEAYRRDLRRAEYGDERDPKMRAVLEQISPLHNVANISKPMLVEQGVNDPRVPKGESDQIVAALRARGVPVGYLVFADEGHGWRKKPNQDLARGEETMFLQKLFAGPR